MTPTEKQLVEVLSRTSIRRLFQQKRHRGVQAEIARELGISRTTVHQWLYRGGRSARIERAAQAKAQELIANEAK